MAGSNSCDPLNFCVALFVYLLMIVQTEVFARGSAEGSGELGDNGDSSTGTLHSTTIILLVLLGIALTLLIITGICILVFCAWFIRRRRREEAVHHEFPWQLSLKSITPITSMTSSPVHSQGRLSHQSSHYSTNQMPVTVATKSGLPYSKSVLTALDSSGRQTVHRVSQSNPELTILQCHGSSQHLTGSPSAQYNCLSHNEIDAQANQIPTFQENSCYPVSVEVLPHRSVMCTSVSSLPADNTCAIVSLGRIRTGWQH